MKRLVSILIGATFLSLSLACAADAGPYEDFLQHLSRVIQPRVTV